MSFYPDISHHRPVKNWASVKTNCPFIISKATQGTGYIDSTLNNFISHCENMGIPYWLYTFLNKGNELAQTKFMVKTCEKKVGKYFVGYVLDVEDNNHPQDVLEALTWLEKQGEKCMVYIGYRHYEKYDAVIDNMGKNTALWESRYGINNGKYNTNAPCHNRTDLHQYTSMGTCPGITGKCDLNRLTGRKNEDWFTTPLSVKKTVVTKGCFAKCEKDETSIIKALESVGAKSSFSYRSSIAYANGIKNYRGTAEQNIEMLELLKDGKLKKPATYSYYKKCSSKHVSIVNALNEINVENSFSYREKIAKANGINNYEGTASQNTTMLNLLKAGKLKKV